MTKGFQYLKETCDNLFPKKFRNIESYKIKDNPLFNLNFEQLENNLECDHI